MLNEIKEELLKNSDAIVELLEFFDFAHISPSAREIRFARDDCGGKNISIRLENNENVYVNDYARGVSKDIFSYIIQEKNVTFREVIQKTKQTLNLSNDWRPQRRQALFGGIYNNIKRQNRDIILKTYDESILSQYEQCGNTRFLHDGISLEAQKFWDIRFSISENTIVIPIHNEYAELVGAKSRINWNPGEDEQKYYYSINFPSSQVLFGYSENYSYMYNSDVVVVESEKSVMQAYTFGYRNIVALGSHSVSEKQARLLLQLQPKRIILALDEGLKFEHTQRNVETIKRASGMFCPSIWYWDSDQDLDIPAKCSPTDLGEEKFQEIMREQLVTIQN